MKKLLTPPLLLSLTCCVGYGLEISGAGDLPGGSTYSALDAVSGDGRNFAGSTSSLLGFEGLYINPSGESFGVGDLDGGSLRSPAKGVSNSGNVTGTSSSANGTEAYLWSESGMLIGLGDLEGGAFFSAATDISDDGSQIVGVGYSNQGREAFLWKEGIGMTGLGDLPGGLFESCAFGISPDGSYIAGESESYSTIGQEAFIWSEENGIIGIGRLSGANYSRAYDVSNGGIAVIGESGSQAFRWTANAGMIGLGFLDPRFPHSSALGLSADGNLVIGTSLTTIGARKNEGEETAFVWTSKTGMLPLARVLEVNGLREHGWILSRATSISNDGTVIVGEGINPEGISEGFIIRGISLAGIHLADPIEASLSISRHPLAVNGIIDQSSALLTYQLQRSDDLQKWLNVGPSIKGNEAPLEEIYQPIQYEENAPQFFRIKASVENE